MEKMHMLFPCNFLHERVIASHWLKNRIWKAKININHSDLAVIFNWPLQEWMKFPSFCLLSTAFDTSIFLLQLPTVVCNHVQNPSILTSLVHFPHVLAKSFIIFMTNTTETLRKVVCVWMHGVQLYTHTAAQVFTVLQHILHNILLIWLRGVSHKVVHHVFENLSCLHV